MVCVDGRDWEAVIRGVARHLGEGEATLAHVVDERAPRGYELSLRGLLGRRDRRPEESMAPTSWAAAEELLADASALLKRLRPDLAVHSAVLSGPPNEELMRAAGEAETIFVGRGTPGSRPRATVRGVVRGWRQNPHGETDGLTLDDGIEVGFPPHRASDIRALVREGAHIEASGTWRGRYLHAHAIIDPNSGASTEAHKFPGEGPGKRPLGHTARFVTDHALCDVVILRL